MTGHETQDGILKRLLVPSRSVPFRPDDSFKGCEV